MSSYYTTTLGINSNSRTVCFLQKGINSIQNVRWSFCLKTRYKFLELMPKNVLLMEEVRENSILRNRTSSQKDDLRRKEKSKILELMPFARKTQYTYISHAFLYNFICFVKNNGVMVN